MEIAKEVQALIKRQAEGADKVSKEIIIKNQNDFEKASELFLKVKQAGKYIMAEKEKMTRGLLDSLANIRSFFKPYEIMQSNAEKEISNKILEYQLKEEQKSQTKIETVVKKVEKGTMTFEKANEKIEALEVSKKVEVNTGAIQFKTVRDYEIIDEKLILNTFWVLDLVKLRKDALDGVEIPGVKVVEKKIINSKLN